LKLPQIQFPKPRHPHRNIFLQTRNGRWIDPKSLPRANNVPKNPALRAGKPGIPPPHPTLSRRTGGDATRLTFKAGPGARVAPTICHLLTCFSPHLPPHPWGGGGYYNPVALAACDSPNRNTASTWYKHPCRRFLSPAHKQRLCVRNGQGRETEYRVDASPMGIPPGKRSMNGFGTAGNLKPAKNTKGVYITFVGPRQRVRNVHNKLLGVGRPATNNMLRGTVSWIQVPGVGGIYAKGVSGAWGQTVGSPPKDFGGWKGGGGP
jgi:hypothetical protein